MTQPNPQSSSGFTVEPGFALVAAGALIAIVSTFLPWEESPSSRPIEHNTLIQQGGWLVIALSLAAAASAYAVGSGQTHKWWGPYFFIGAAALWLIVEGNSSDTLYPVNSDGSLDTSQQGVKASLGIAIYVAWLGVALMGIGARVGRGSVQSREGKGTLPDPASSTVVSTPPAAAGRQATANETTSRIRCFKCQHIQQVRASVTTYYCEECGQKLQRRPAS